HHVLGVVEILVRVPRPVAERDGVFQPILEEEAPAHLAGLAVRPEVQRERRPLGVGELPGGLLVGSGVALGTEGPNRRSARGWSDTRPASQSRLRNASIPLAAVAL